MYICIHMYVYIYIYIYIHIHVYMRTYHERPRRKEWNACLAKSGGAPGRCEKIEKDRAVPLE